MACPEYLYNLWFNAKLYLTAPILFCNSEEIIDLELLRWFLQVCSCLFGGPWTRLVVMIPILAER
jgi:hypothetical protein